MAGSKKSEKVEHFIATNSIGKYFKTFVMATVFCSIWTFWIIFLSLMVALAATRTCSVIALYLWLFIVHTHRMCVCVQWKIFWNDCAVQQSCCNKLPYFPLEIVYYPLVINISFVSWHWNRTLIKCSKIKSVWPMRLWWWCVTILWRHNARKNGPMHARVSDFFHSRMIVHCNFTFFTLDVALCVHFKI